MLVQYQELSRIAEAPRRWAIITLAMCRAGRIQHQRANTMPTNSIFLLTILVCIGVIILTILFVFMYLLYYDCLCF